MPLDSYANLQASVLDWIARPGDPLVAPAVPDMIVMFEEEARDRLKNRFTEVTLEITPPPATSIIPLPSDYGSMRELYITTSLGNRHMQYQPPYNLDQNLWTYSGYEIAFTIEGLNLRMVGDSGGDDDDDDFVPDTITMVYMQGIPALTSANPTNWLLENYPSLYLWGTLTFAGLYIGDDPRVGGWLQAREAGFQRVQLADRKARYPQGLMIQPDVRNP